MPATPESWISLTEAKNHLNITAATSNADVDELAEFIRRAERGIVNKVGHVKQPDNPIAEYRRGGRPTVRVNQVPLGTVTAISVQGQVVPAADLDTGSDGWYFDDSSEGELRAGIIRHTSCFPHGFVKISFKPGRDPIPEDLTNATLDLLAHLWETQRGGAGVKGRPGLRGEDSGTEGERRFSTFTYPRRVNEQIHAYLLPVTA